MEKEVNANSSKELSHPIHKLPTTRPHELNWNFVVCFWVFNVICLRDDAESFNDQSRIQLQQLTNLINRQDCIGVELWLVKNILSQKQKTILNQYDEDNECTPIHQACWKNNVELLQLLLQYKANVNAFWQPNKSKYTTMHIAAINENVSMMKLLIQHGFDCDKFINNIYYQNNHRSVFLHLCANGNVECMDYLMNHDECKNKIDIWQRDIDGSNSLHIAVSNQHVPMVKYLLNKVYKNEEVKQKLFNQTVGISGMHISCVAAQKGATQQGLSIFRLLVEAKCPMHPQTISYAASHSSLILNYMLSEQLYPDYIYLTDTLLISTLGNADAHLVHKNLLIIVKYLSNMKDHASINDYTKGIVNIFYYIMTIGTMDGYFKMFKEMIAILLKCNNWKYFIKSEILDKTLLKQIEEKINNPTNTTDIADSKWCVLLKTMIDSFDDKTLLNKYDNYQNDDESEFKTNNENDDDNSVTKLIQLLTNNEFEQFNQILSQFTEIKAENIVKTVICNKSDLLLYWIWIGKIVLPCYKNEGDKATQLSLEHLIGNGSNKEYLNTIFNTKYVKNQTLFNMIMQNRNMRSTESLQMLIDYEFDFEKLINVYDNVKHQNGFIQMCRMSTSYEEVKMLFDHCKTLKKCKIDFTHCDINRTNALMYAALCDINTFKYLLSNECFPNHDEMDDKNVIIALNQHDLYGRTVAHIAAHDPTPHVVDTFKLLKKYDFNFKVYDNYGRLPIHWVCETNSATLLSWMIDENVLDNDINCKTKYSRNEHWNGQTPLYTAIFYNSVECVDVLCKETKNIRIERRDIYEALKNDNVEILKFLLCGLFMKCQISSWNDIQSLSSSNIISSKQINLMISYCQNNISSKECYQFLNDLFVNGYSQNNLKYIVLKLDYNLKLVMNEENDMDDEMKHDEISSMYEITKDLGNGTFGEVKLAKHKKTGEKAAIKYISTSSSSLQLITSEIESLKKLSTHSNIINLLNYVINKTEVLLYFEYCQYGDLYQLLHQCDSFSLRISFKYFLQLLSAISTCHKINIVHRDLKLQNILISNTFQLKVADFGLASIVDNKNDKIYNVGTPMYKSPELLEGCNSSYDISSIIVLKSCDVFSLSIIFWQMMNGIEYLPFKCYENTGINQGNYSLIKTKQFDKFWKMHQNCNMISKDNNGNDNQLLLCNLFEQMFSYNPHERITIDKILKHKFIALNENDALFYMNDSQLEAFIRPEYHKTKNVKKDDIKHVKAPSTYYDPKLHPNGPYMYGNNTTTNNNETSGFHGFEYLNRDSSLAQINVNESKVYLDQIKIIYSFKPLVVMIGISKYKQNDNNMNHKRSVTYDYINVKQMLHDLKHFDIIYHNNKHQVVHLKYQNNVNNESSVLFNETNNTRASISKIEQEFALEWTSNDLNNFNNQVFNILETKNSNYDCLIYILSCHFKQLSNNGKHILYDSNGDEYSCDYKIFDTFNNLKCSNLYKKGKIFVLNGDIIDNNENDDENKDDDMDTFEVDKKIDFDKQYNRIIYLKRSNNDKDDSKDGALLINSFCTSLCNNINDNTNHNEDEKEKDLTDIINETKTRLFMNELKVSGNNKNILKFYDENSIPKTRKIVFTSYKPFKSTQYFEQSIKAVARKNQTTNNDAPN